MSLVVPKRWNRPWLWLPSQWSHDLAPWLLPLLTPFFSVSNSKCRSFQWKNLNFPNPMGIAGGVDKSGRSLKQWAQLGAGFVEVGTVTPEPQGPNPGTIMARHIAKRALWNKMGFPNPGSRALQETLQNKKSLDVPLFVNVGKNRWTENQQAFADYGLCMERLKDFADVFVVNLSSPNTKGLRDLLDKNHLEAFLTSLFAEIKNKQIHQPILLKLSPDMEAEALQNALQISSRWVDGWILTNTTRDRYPDCPFNPKEGGLSGVPLKELSLQALKVAGSFKKQHPEKLLVSVGGISSTEDVVQRLELGADLVQFYSALVFEGPGFFGRQIKQLSALSSNS